MKVNRLMRSVHLARLILVLVALVCSSVGVAQTRIGTGSRQASLTKNQKHPNFVFLFADDLGWGDLGSYGNRQIKTPHLDHLASQGTRFTQFYVASAVCSPSRAAFLTGHFPARHRIHGHFATSELNARRGMPNFLDPNVTTLPDILREAGYTTAHYGKWHLGDQPGSPPPAEYGFDQARSVISIAEGWNTKEDIYRTNLSRDIVDETIRFVEANREKPFYVQAWFFDPHSFLKPSPEHLAAYKNLRGARQTYYAAVTNLDAQIGRLLARLDELGLAENTVIVFSSDNGPEDLEIYEDAAGSPGPLRGRKRSLYEGGISVPFIVRYPGITPAGKVDDSTVIGAVDFPATVAALAGVKLPNTLNLDGEDLSRGLAGMSVERSKPLLWEWRFRVFGHVFNRNPMLAIRDGRWKLLMNPNRSRVELYDISRDRREMIDLAVAHPDVVQRLATRLLAWHAGLPKGPVDPDAGSDAYPFPAKPSD